MPRQSKAALTIAHLSPVRRLEPPAELGPLEAAIFREIVASAPYNHFQPEDMTLLAAYARAAGLERRAADELQAAAVVAGSPSPWLAVHASITRSMLQLSVRLRLGPRSREPSNRRRATKSTSPPSYYDLMAMEGK